MPIKIAKVILFLSLAPCLLSLAYAAPSYSTTMPEKKHFSLGVQTHAILKSYLNDEFGELRSFQNFLLVSYGAYDWFSLDLKGGASNLKAHPRGSDELDYPSGFSGGYGFRVKVYEKRNLKSVFGFQHISVHPADIDVGEVKHKAILDDWQFSLLASYNLKKITPYLGVRWSRLDYIHWQDGSRKRVKPDRTKQVGLVFGSEFTISKVIWLNLGFSFLDNESVSFSLNYSF